MNVEKIFNLTTEQHTRIISIGVIAAFAFAKGYSDSEVRKIMHYQVLTTDEALALGDSFRASVESGLSSGGADQLMRETGITDFCDEDNIAKAIDYVRAKYKELDKKHAEQSKERDIVSQN